MFEIQILTPLVRFLTVDLGAAYLSHIKLSSTQYQLWPKTSCFVSRPVLHTVTNTHGLAQKLASRTVPRGFTPPCIEGFEPLLYSSTLQPWGGFPPLQ